MVYPKADEKKRWICETWFSDLYSISHYCSAVAIVRRGFSSQNFWHDFCTIFNHGFRTISLNRNPDRLFERSGGVPSNFLECTEHITLKPYPRINRAEIDCAIFPAYRRNCIYDIIFWKSTSISRVSSHVVPVLPSSFLSPITWIHHPLSWCSLKRSNKSKLYLFFKTSSQWLASVFSWQLTSCCAWRWLYHRFQKPDSYSPQFKRLLVFSFLNKSSHPRVEIETILKRTFNQFINYRISAERYFLVISIYSL